MIRADVKGSAVRRNASSAASSFGYMPISILFLLVGPLLLVAWGGVSARFATAMFAVVEPAELKGAVGDVLGRVGRADAFEIMDQLKLRLGRGPFLSATASRRRCSRSSPPASRRHVGKDIGRRMRARS